jgi:alanine dehydrogenase
MNVSVVRERRPGENRVGLTPAGVDLLTAEGHRCYVEQGAGVGAGFADEDYSRAGARIVYSGDEIYGRGDLVLKVARPTAEELTWLREGQTVLAFWHLISASPDNLETLLRRKITAFAYETIQADDGSLPVLKPMSQIAGQMSAHVAASLLQNNSGGKGVLLGGITGVPPAEVIIIGAGVVGTNAALAFSNMGAAVYVLDRGLAALERVAERCDRVITMVSHAFNVRKVVRFADVLVTAALMPGARAPSLVTREMVREMRPRSIILDIAIDQGGCVETSRPTTHQTPTFVAENVIHYCVPNMPGVLGRTATHALNNATWPFVQLLAAQGSEAAAAANPALARGLATHAGKIASPALRQPWGQVGA